MERPLVGRPYNMIHPLFDIEKSCIFLYRKHIQEHLSVWLPGHSGHRYIIQNLLHQESKPLIFKHHCFVIYMCQAHVHEAILFRHGSYPLGTA